MIMELLMLRLMRILMRTETSQRLTVTMHRVVSRQQSLFRQEKFATIMEI